ncbi:MAG: ferritin-like domain-containing protein [Actinomycetota bacterium]|nr:ferritin-like domain-containing protein [Actinomycetota bacterium]
MAEAREHGSTTGVPPGATTASAAIKAVRDNADAIFTWRYDRERPQLSSLYQRAVVSQWNSETDLDWDTDVDPERLATEMLDDLVPPIVRAAAAVPGSPIASWTDNEFTALGVELLRARTSQFMHGEQGAMLVAAKLVETVPWVEAKYLAATQTIDEARHTEVFARYLSSKLGEAYPCNADLESQLTALVEDSRWDISYLGMQIVIESLALAAFGSLHRITKEPLLRSILRYIMADEARHVAFGVLSLRELYRELSSAELKERQEFLLESSLSQQKRAFMPEMWERLGVPIPPLLTALAAAAASGADRGFYATFPQQFYAKLVPNVRKLGLLDANNGWLRRKWQEEGLLEFEYWEDPLSEEDAERAVNGSAPALPSEILT